MTSLDLARECLWLLIDGGALQPVERDRLVAYRTYYLPAVIALELPDRDRYRGLLDPATRSAHAAQLVAAILHVATVEDRDGWVVRHSELRLHVGHATDRRPRARPVDDANSLPEPLEPQPEVASRSPALPVLEVRTERAGGRRGEPVVVDSHGGMVPLARGPWHPRVSLFAPAGAPPYLLSTGSLTLVTHDGRTRQVEPNSPAVLAHDGVFVAHPQRGRLWQRAVKGAFELLGVARTARPPLTVYQPGAERLVWDRNELPELALPSPRTPWLALHAEAGDVLRARAVDGAQAELLYFDGQPLEIPVGPGIHLHGAHLRGARFAGAATPLRVRPSLPASPACFELRATPTHSARPDRTTPREPIFGFEAPFASVFQDGVRLSPTDVDGTLRPIDVASRSFRGPVLRLAIDGLAGCKVMPLCDGLELDGEPVRPEVWRWVQGVVTVTCTGLRLRLEATEPGRVGVMFEQPRLVATLSRDPENGWRTHGWCLVLGSDGLTIDGHSRRALRVDGRLVTEPTAMPGADVHRVELDTGVYRMLRLDLREESREHPQGRSPQSEAMPLPAGRAP